MMAHTFPLQSSFSFKSILALYILCYCSLLGIVQPLVKIALYEHSHCMNGTPRYICCWIPNISITSYNLHSFCMILHTLLLLPTLAKSGYALNMYFLLKVGLALYRKLGLVKSHTQLWPFTCSLSEALSSCALMTIQLVVIMICSHT